MIEKCWLAHGHKFTDRCGFIQQDPKEISPIFTQFVGESPSTPRADLGCEVAASATGSVT